MGHASQERVRMGSECCCHGVNFIFFAEEVPHTYQKAELHPKNSLNHVTYLRVTSPTHCHNPNRDLLARLQRIILDTTSSDPRDLLDLNA